jgi:hypothetical protein
MANEKHLIDEEALVYCAIRGKLVDVERCLGCRRLVEYDLDARRPYLVCRGPEDHRPDPPQ